MTSKFKKVPSAKIQAASSQNALAALLKQARSSGTLNLSNRSLDEVPESVWRINLDVPEEGKTLSLDNCGERWWEQVDLVKLILASNLLTSISENISFLPALTSLDLHDNKLSTLPDAVGNLTEISRLNISQNSFVELPSCIFQLKKLCLLHVQQNEIKSLPKSIGDLNNLEEFDLSCNKIEEFPPSIGFLTKLRKFSASENRLKNIPHEIEGLTCLRVLDLKQNYITNLPDELGHLRHLELLYLQMNQIKTFPRLERCSVLKELYLGKNFIEKIPPDFLTFLSSLAILDLRENRLDSIPNEISQLECLERLDLTNNMLAVIPNSLGLMGNLKIISLEGNTLRSIRRDIIARGTGELKKYLVSRMAPEELPSDSSVSSLQSQSSQRSCDSGIIGINNNVIDEITLSHTKALDLSEKKYSGAADNEVFDIAARCGVTQLNCSKNMLTSIPDKLLLLKKSLNDLNLSFNKLTSLPSDIGMLERLAIINLSNNQLSDLPDDMKNLQLLRDINISFNKFKTIPRVVYELKNIENISISDNKVESFDALKLCELLKLSSLDLQNNNISSVDPLLGRCTQLRSCKLEGNQFRNPRPAILAKGTIALLEFLRDRIPH